MRPTKLKNDKKVQQILDVLEQALGKENGAKLIGILTDGLFNFIKAHEDEETRIETIEIKFNETSLIYDCHTDTYMKDEQFDA